MDFSKILLIHPLHSDLVIVPPAGLGYIAAIFEEKGLKAKVIDCQVEKDYEKQIVSNVKDYPVVGISANINSAESALRITKLIRKHSPQTKIIMGGPHPTAVYNQLIPEYADIAVMGEGEDTFAELVNDGDLSKIRGIAYWDNGIKVNAPRPLIEDLDRLPYPAWHLFDLKKYKNRDLPIPQVYPYVIMITTRGCPYPCINCTKFVHGSKIRSRSIENIMGEIEHVVKKFRVREIWISDDNFTFYPERTKEICRQIIKRGYSHIRFTLTNGIRADIADYEMFKLMADAGFYAVALGIESGSQDVLNGLSKELNLKVVRKTVDMLKKLKFQVWFYIMIGLPFDTVDTIQETLNFAKSLPVDRTLFYMTTPFPGTKLYDLVKERGKFLRDLTKGAPSYHEGKVLYEMDHLKAREIEVMFRKVHREYYLRPIQIWRMIIRKFQSPRSFSLEYILDSILRFFKFGYRIIVKGKRIGGE